MYANIYNNILYPFYETVLKKRKTFLYLKELEKSQWLSEEKLREVQWGRLQKLLQHAYENVPYYRKKFNEAGLTPKDIKTQEDFRKLPVLTKDDIRNSNGELVAQNHKRDSIFENVTGGSTGTPLKFKLDHNGYEWRQAAIKRVYGWAGYKDGEKTALIWGAAVHKEPMFKRIKHQFDEALKRHKLYNTFYFNEKTMNIYIEKINRFKPEFIIAYTTPLFNLARFIKENNKLIHPPKSIIVGAEKLYPIQRKVIEEVFNAPLFETYGCREVTSIAGECEKHAGMHINTEKLFLEIVRDNKPVQPEETGEIIITDLTNYAMPFIRYKNEDLGSFSGQKCACGRGLGLIHNIEGRTLDTIKTADGRLIPGEFFIYWLMQFEEIIKFQVIQEDLGTLIIKIVKREKMSKERLDLLRKIVFDVMGKNISIDFQFVDDIALTLSGKYRVVISNVPVNFGN